jgi:hypothetical protein
MNPVALLMCAVLTLVAAWVVAQPLLMGPSAAAAPPPGGEDPAHLLMVEKEILYQSLHELDLDYAAGKLSEQDYRALRAKQEVQAVELLKAIDAASGTAPGRPAAPQPRKR